MDQYRNPTAQKLLRAFMQFNRIGWYQRSTEGYKLSEIKVLFCIRKAMRPDTLEMKVSEISKHLHVTSPTVTQSLKNLEANGLVERHVDPTDRRSVGIKLTERGEAVTQRAAEALVASFGGLIEYLGEEQSNQLADLLSKALHYFSEREASVYHPQWNGDEEA